MISVDQSEWRIDDTPVGTSVHWVTGMLVTILLLMSAAAAKGEYRQPSDHLLEGAVTAIAYSGYREGQHPDRGGGRKESY
ncbi:hypothetical protein OAX71_06585 [Pseudomonadales bacterium]|nr:hypothetical protein [Pseudomonadales bacterium]